MLTRTRSSNPKSLRLQKKVSLNPRKAIKPIMTPNRKLKRAMSYLKLD